MDGAFCLDREVKVSAGARRVSDLGKMIRLGETLLRTKPVVEALTGITRLRAPKKTAGRLPCVPAEG